MSNEQKIKSWTAKLLSKPICQRLDRLSKCRDVVRIAVMPDVHLAQPLCNGVVVATRNFVLPEAVGGDIGCGYLMADISGGNAEELRQIANDVLRRIERSVPIIRHAGTSAERQLSNQLNEHPLSGECLNKLKYRDARVQLGTLGRGNHFVEIQESNAGSLHLLIHSGSRAVGQAILSHHLRYADIDSDSKARFLTADSDAGKAYLNDMEWARGYAKANRWKILQAVDQTLQDVGFKVEIDSAIDKDHNHVEREVHDGGELLVHRKGAQRLDDDEVSIVPGSMGEASYLVSGRGCQAAMYSCAHGAGRQLARKEAANQISVKDLKRQMGNVYFDQSKSRRLLDEAPAAYKDIRLVMKAQKLLVRIEQPRWPVLNFKAG